MNSPGGRSGATASPAYADLAIPTAAAVGKCMVFLGGHGSGESEAWWKTTYCASDGSSIIRRMLARGWHVLCVDMPDYGVQPQPQIVYSAGSPVSYTAENSHAYSALFSDGGPNPNRLFLDHIRLAMNQIASSFALSFSLVGHSGGANVAAMLACVDARFRVVHLLQAGSFNGAGSSSDVEAWSGNNAIIAAGGYISNAALVGAAFSGRATIIHTSPNDEYFGGDYPLWQAWQPSAVAALPFAALSLALRTGTHAIDATQAVFVENHLLANA